VAIFVIDTVTLGSFVFVVVIVIIAIAAVAAALALPDFMLSLD
jgi:hypothetical protein